MLKTTDRYEERYLQQSIQLEAVVQESTKVINQLKYYLLLKEL